jgi:hypothetical protein
LSSTIIPLSLLHWRTERKNVLALRIKPRQIFNSLQRNTRITTQKLISAGEYKRKKVPREDFSQAAARIVREATEGG